MKVKFGAIIVAGSGKIGGHVAARNRSGAYMRTKVTPVNPSSSYQSAVRNRLSGLAQGWRSLLAAQRAAWNAAVGDFSKTDVFGDIKNPSGFNLYQKLNNNLLNIGKSALTSPPLPSAVDYFTSFSCAAEDASDAELLTLTFAPAIAADHSVKVLATPPMSAGVSFVKSEYRQIGILTSVSASPFDATTLYQAKFGSTGQAGQKIFVKMVQVSDDSGIVGTALEASAIVTVSVA